MAPAPPSPAFMSQLTLPFTLISSGLTKVSRLIYENQSRNLSEIFIYPEVNLERSKTNSVQAKNTPLPAATYAQAHMM